MKETRYVLEIYKPESVTDILISFASVSPFMYIERGALLDPQAWGKEYGAGKLLRVMNVEHSIGETDAITHKARVFTEELEDSSEARYGREARAYSPFSRFRDRAKEVAKEIHPSGLAGRGARFLEDQTPWIQVLLKDKIGPIAKETLQDEESMTQAFRTVYEFLPMPVRLAVNVESFIAFCLKNQKRLIERNEKDEWKPQTPTSEHEER